MNLFFLSVLPTECAEYHCDKHVVKMILEIVQMLYTAHILAKSDNLMVDHYRKISNHNHPMAIWIRKCSSNYLYAAEVGISIAHEYTKRYHKVHSCEKHVKWLYEHLPEFNNVDYIKKCTFATNDYFISLGMTPIPLCMPEDCYLDDPIKSYRKYYLLHKKHFATWKVSIPCWFCLSDIRKYFNSYKIM